jgi:uncharacterized protein (DUF58 family)
MEFEEVRGYQTGDDIRAIDWNVTARYGRPFVKSFREERELVVMLLVDISGSHEFGTSHQLKRELAAEVCATLALSAVHNNDRTGMILFTDKVEKYVPPKKGRRHALRLVRDLLYFCPEHQGTDLTPALHQLNRVVRRRCVAFVVSDFQANEFERPLRVSRHRHDIIPVMITDPCETELPDVGIIELLDSETGEVVLVDTSDKRLRSQYSAETTRKTEERRRLFARCDTDAIEVITGTSFVESLIRFFTARRARL